MDNKSLYPIITAVIITALLVGGTVYYTQKSSIKNLQNDIIELKNSIQSQNNQVLQDKMSDLENQISNLQNKNTESGSKAADGPELTNSIVLSLLKNDLPKYSENPSGLCLSGGFGEEYRSCKIDIAKTNNQWNVIITYDRLADDSIRAERVKAAITYVNGVWIKGTVSKDQKCQPNRGHQDFSSENCI